MGKPALYTAESMAAANAKYMADKAKAKPLLYTAESMAAANAKYLQKVKEADPVYQMEQQKIREAETAAKLASGHAAQQLELSKRRSSMGGAGRAGTILTSPLGLPATRGAVSAGRRTILGG